MVIIPLNNYIIVEPIDRDDSFNEELQNFSMPPSEYVGVPNIGVVKAVEENKYSIKPGDKIIFDNPRPHGLWLDGTRLLPITLKEVRGLLE